MHVKVLPLRRTFGPLTLIFWFEVSHLNEFDLTMRLPAGAQKMHPQSKNITEAAVALSQRLFHYSLSTRLLQDLCVHDIIADCLFPVQPEMRLVYLTHFS